MLNVRCPMCGIVADLPGAVAPPLVGEIDWQSHPYTVARSLGYSAPLFDDRQRATVAAFCQACDSDYCQA